MTRRPSVPVLPVLLAVILTTVVFGISASSAQTDDQVRVARSATGVVGELEADLDRAQSTIDVLQTQLAQTRKTSLNRQARIDTQRATILSMRQTQVLAASLQTHESGIDQWRAGYAMGGGSNLAAFENTILPCESGGQPDPDRAIGPTDDWGRAQINRPTWSAHFEELTGLAFEDHILDPVLNGYMAAVVEQEQGLRAWTCWRIR